MIQRLNVWNQLGHIAAFLLIVHTQQVLSQSQTDNSEDIEYDWSTFLLLVIPVLIILVVLVLCVTGVFMFCLSTLTMNYDQEYFGSGAGAETPSGDKISLPKVQLNLDKDLLKYRQSLQVLETVKLSAEDSAPLHEEGSTKRRTETGLEPEVDLKQRENRESIVVQLEDKKNRKEVVIDMEPCGEKNEVDLCQESKSKHSTSNFKSFPSSDNDSSLSKSKSRYPTLMLPASLPTLQQLKLEYYRPQSAFHSVPVIGVRG